MWTNSQSQINDGSTEYGILWQNRHLLQKKVFTHSDRKTKLSFVITGSIAAIALKVMINAIRSGTWNFLLECLSLENNRQVDFFLCNLFCAKLKRQFTQICEFSRQVFFSGTVTNSLSKNYMMYLSRKLCR